MKEEGQISQHGKGKNTFYILKEGAVTDKEVSA